MTEKPDDVIEQRDRLTIFGLIKALVGLPQINVGLEKTRLCLDYYEKFKNKINSLIQSKGYEELNENDFSQIQTNSQYCLMIKLINIGKPFDLDLGFYSIIISKSKLNLFNSDRAEIKNTTKSQVIFGNGQSFVDVLSKSDFDKMEINFFISIINDPQSKCVGYKDDKGNLSIMICL